MNATIATLSDALKVAQAAVLAAATRQDVDSWTFYRTQAADLQNRLNRAQAAQRIEANRAQRSAFWSVANNAAG